MNAKMLTLGVVTLLGAGAAVVVLTRPVPHDPRSAQNTTVERLPGELPALRDEAAHYAPGSPAGGTGSAGAAVFSSKSAGGRTRRSTRPPSARAVTIAGTSSRVTRP